MEQYIKDKIEFVGDHWMWKGAKHLQGYPMIRNRKTKKMVLVARMMMEEKIGRELDGREERVKNTCGNKLCVNPDHYILARRGSQEWKCVANLIPDETRKQIQDDWFDVEYYHGLKKDLVKRYKITYSTLYKILKERDPTLSLSKKKRLTSIA